MTGEKFKERPSDGALTKRNERVKKPSYGFISSLLAKARNKILDVLKPQTEINESYLSVLLDSISDPVFVKDTDGFWVFANNAFFEMTGFARSDVIGKKDRQFVSHNVDEVDKYKESDETAILGKDTQLETKFKDASGNLRDIVTKKKRYVDENGNVFIIGVMTDVTEQKNKSKEMESAVRKRTVALMDANNELQKMKDEAISGSVAKSVFLANMSHEIRTPLNGIIGGLDIIKDSKMDDDAKHLINDIIEPSAKTLMTLLNDILDVSKMEAGKLKIERIILDIDEVLMTVIESAKMSSRIKGITFNYAKRSDIPDFIGDPTRIRQIIGNMCSNAIKFTGKGGVHLDVFLTDENEKDFTLNMRVSDTGIGIKQEQLKLLFEKFQQADDSTTRLYGGTGLGLSIIKGLSELMGGRVLVKSIYGKGSVFTCSIPVQKAEICPMASQMSGRVLLSKPHKYTALIIDDDKISQEITSRALTKMGFSVEICSNAEDALSAARRNKYSIIAMDVFIPGKNGLEIAHEIREFDGGSCQSPIIALTANGTPEFREDCIFAGMDDCLVKPVKKKDFAKSINRVMDRIDASRRTISETITIIETDIYRDISSNHHEL